MYQSKMQLTVRKERVHANSFSWVRSFAVVRFFTSLKVIALLCDIILLKSISRKNRFYTKRAYVLEISYNDKNLTLNQLLSLHPLILNFHELITWNYGLKLRQFWLY